MLEQNKNFLILVILKYISYIKIYKLFWYLYVKINKMNKNLCNINRNKEKNIYIYVCV